MENLNKDQIKKLNHVDYMKVLKDSISDIEKGSFSIQNQKTIIKEISNRRFSNEDRFNDLISLLQFVLSICKTLKISKDISNSDFLSLLKSLLKIECYANNLPKAISQLGLNIKEAGNINSIILNELEGYDFTIMISDLQNKINSIESNELKSWNKCLEPFSSILKFDPNFSSHFEYANFYEKVLRQDISLDYIKKFKVTHFTKARKIISVSFFI